jgi:SAM-dependent methyltransferase
MNPDEYLKLEQVEKEHWFYAGKRRIVFDWLERLGALGKERLLLDCGAGTGRFVAEARERCRAIAVDDHDESLEIASRLLGPENVRRGSCVELPFEDEAADIITALDVIEHIEDDARAVREMARVLKKGGYLVITVPAFQALWSDWDVALHHFRRYRRDPLVRLLQDASLEIIHAGYINVLAFPAVFAMRKWRTLFPRPEAGGPRAEERIPPPWLNRLLFATFVGLATQKAVRFPFGVGLLAIARRRA